MNSITSRFSGSATLIFFPLYFIWRKGKKISLIFLFFIALTISSCFQTYYKTNTKPKADTDLLQKLQSTSKVFIVHFKNNVSELNNINIKNDTIQADIVQLSEEHLKYLDPKTDKGNRVKKADKPIVFAEVHMYTNEKKNEDGKLMLPLDSINRIDVYELDKNATTTNQILSIVGVTLGALLIISATATAIACNCPQVYVNNNSQYQFNGGMYSGAIYSSLERTDYMPLVSLQPVDNLLSLKIGNAPNEEQFINNVKLLSVNHPINTKAMVDRHGNIFTIKNTESPISAVVDVSSNANEALKSIDQNYYSFNNTPADNNFSNVILNFKKPKGTGKAKLILSGKNSNWSGYVYNEFNSLFGEGMDDWKKKKENADPKEMEQWQKDQALPIMVYIQNGVKWKYVDYYSIVGNTAPRDLIMELDLADINEETVTIKLESVYRFWDLDYAGLDFSENEIISSSYINPVKAESSDTTNEINNLLANDKLYTHLTGVETVSLEFQQPFVDKRITSSYFLVGNGYYHSLKQYEGKTKKIELLEFKNKGAFNAFSRAKYNALNNELAKYAVTK